MYPERIPVEHHAASLFDTDTDLVERLAWALTHRPQRERVVADLRPVMARYDWSEVAPGYDAAIELVTARGSR